MKEFWVVVLVVIAVAIFQMKPKNLSDFAGMEHVNWDRITPDMYHELEMHVPESQKMEFNKSFKELMISKGRNVGNVDEYPYPLRETRKEAGTIRTM
jgi:hypothetical protein